MVVVIETRRNVTWLYSMCIILDKIVHKNLNIQSEPRSKHSVLVIKTSQLKLYREIIAVCSQIHTKHINALWTEHTISVC